MITIRYASMPPGLTALAARDDDGDLVIIAGAGLPPGRRKAAVCMAKRAVQCAQPAAGVAAHGRHAERHGPARTVVAAVAGAVTASLTAVTVFLALPAAQATPQSGTLQVTPRPHMHRRRPERPPELRRVAAHASEKVPDAA